MKKLKICVYAISKNEEQFVDRWYESIKDADEIYVLDTGSTDNTVEKMKKYNIKVSQKIITPWRFDVARNESLKLVPSDVDVCICLDLDEIVQKGWRKEIENNWIENTTKLKYLYNWKLDENNNPLVNFFADKIHSRNDYVWTHPVHEVLTFIGKKENVAISYFLTINHYPDIKKSRSSYLPLLELSVKEDPKDDRNMHYLGREYMYYRRYDEAISTLKRHLRLKKATWKAERSASMRYISRCLIAQGKIQYAKAWLKKAREETPKLREPFVETAQLYYRLQDFKQVIKYSQLALLIKKQSKMYMNEPFCSDECIFELLGVSYYYLGNTHLAETYLRKSQKQKLEKMK